jgi:hypothetical protein
MEQVTLPTNGPFCSLRAVMSARFYLSVMQAAVGLPTIGTVYFHSSLPYCVKTVTVSTRLPSISCP